jgi:6-phospho-beta-glucosidase
MGIKLAIVGAGSTYCPELMQGLIRRKAILPLDELRLADIDAPRLEVVSDFCERLLRENGLSARVTRSAELSCTLDGADFIVCQIRSGQLPARIRDEKIPLAYGLIGQETTGIGGFVNALRTIPQMEAVASAIDRYAPGAWLINFANPSGIVTEYLLRYTRVKSVGLCNLPIGMQERIAKLLELPMAQVRLETVSLNHCGAVTAVYADGENVLPRLLSPSVLRQAAVSDEWTAKYLPIIELLGAVPNDYLQYYFYPGRKLQEQKNAPQTRGEACLDIEARLLAYYRDARNRTIPPMLAERGGHLYSEAAIALIASLSGADPGHHVVDVQNRGVLDFLPDDGVIETSCYVGKDEITRNALTVRPCDPLRALLPGVKTYETLTVQSALTGERDTAIRALSCNPLTADLDKTIPCLNDMLEQNRSLLPRFFQ